MKKYILSSLLLGVLSTMTVGCRDAIDIVQDGELSNDATFSNVTNFRDYLMGIYAGVSNSDEVYITSVFTDEVGYGTANAGQGNTLHRFFLDANNDNASGLWLNHYSTINKVNRLIDGSTKFTPKTDAEQAIYLQTLVEARALRAYSYVQLEAFFSTNMKDANALGVILSDDVPDIYAQKQRVANSEIFKLIESDLNFAAENVNDLIPRPATYPASYFLVNKNMITALRARFYLYKGDNTKAAQYAQQVIENFEASGGKLTPATPLVPASITAAIGSAVWNNNFYGTTSISSVNPYRMMWADKSQGEVIFGLSRPTNGNWSNIANLYTTNLTNASGSPLFEMGRNLFNIIATTPGDVRRYAYIDPTSKIDNNYATSENFKTTDVLIIDKYPGKIGTVLNLRNDVKIFRLSEMYLILAEANANNNNLAAAAANVKKVRDARNYLGATLLPVYSSKVDALTDILKERRVELSFEGHRYVDLKRLGSVVNKTIERDPTDDFIKTLPTSIPISDYRFTLPIPLNEIKANPTIQQNPNY